MPALPHNGYIGFAKEVTWGVNPAAGFEFVPALSEAIKVEQASKVIKGLNNSRVPQRRVLLSRTSGGQLQWECDPEDVIGMMLKNLLPTEGFVDDGVGNGGQHLFTPGNTLSSLTALISRDAAVVGNTWEHVGGYVKQLQFAAAVDETLKATADLSFKNGSSGATAAVPSYTTQNPLVYHTGTVTIDGLAVALKSFSITVAGGLYVDRKKIGSNLIQQQQPGMYAVSGEMEFYLDDLQQVSKFINGNSAAIILDLTGALIGTTQRRLKFEIPTAFYNGETPTMGGPEQEIMLKVPFEAVKIGSGSPNEIVRISLFNSRRSVY